MTLSTRQVSDEIQQEAVRLHSKMNLLGYGLNDCLLLAPLTLEINRLKQEKNAVILAHNYQLPEIVFGIADFVGDSLELSRKAKETQAKRIVFCGVHFMAETAKIVNPEKQVLLPALDAGCSLAESITGQDVRNLRKQYPNAAFVCYVNTSAEVKAECDVCCTSANSVKIIQALPQKQIVYLPDQYMAANLAKLIPEKEIIAWNGLCIVHETFTEHQLVQYKKIYPNAKILAHLECKQEVVQQADLVGGTSDMTKYVQQSSANEFVIVTECGMSDVLREKFPAKQFITPCSICPHMKKINLENVLKTLKEEKNEITVPEIIRLRALNTLNKMFELTGK
ncbi:MAG: quinolinate synthase NadA [Candidatus Diapherotrites archaeon]|nr:quinolinate synthase NadA [Candidatus Diapherotrites archaeon]